MYQVASFSDVTVYPFRKFTTAGNSTEGGPDWPNWDQRSGERLMRAGRLGDQRPSSDPAEGSFAVLPKRIDLGQAYWCGMILYHFGHFVAEFALRILPSRILDPKAKLVFVAEMGHKPPEWFWQIIDWCEVPHEDVVIIREPTILRTLSVVGQPEQLNGAAPTSYHLDMMDGFMAQKGLAINHDAPPIFVSRAGLKMGKARFAGESCLEACLVLAGFLGFRPETTPIRDQLQIYLTSPFVTFSEGSALHLCQLAGRSFGRVATMSRRQGKSHFAPTMEPRCREYVEVAASRQMIMGVNKLGIKENWRAITILDLDEVLNHFEGIRSGVRAHFYVDAFRLAEQADLNDWVAANTGPRKQANWRESDQAMAESLIEAGFDRLAGDVCARAGGAGQDGIGVA